MPKYAKKKNKLASNKPKFSKEDFIVWLSLPKPLKKPQTQGEIAEKYGIAQSTLSRWKRDNALWEEVKKLREYRLREKAPNVDQAFYQRLLKGIATAQDYKLFYQRFEGWSEKQILEHEVGDSLSELLLQIQNEKQPLVKKGSSRPFRENYPTGTKGEDKGQGMET